MSLKKVKMFKSWKINSDKVLSISAIVISLATLILIFYQTDLVRKEQKASVFPSLMFGYNTNSQNQITGESIFIMNQGLGPAFIENFKIVNKGSTYSLNPNEYLSKIDGFDQDEIIYIDKLFEGRIIPADDKIVLLAKKTDSLSKMRLGEIFDFHFNSNNNVNDDNKVFIEIEYKNVYGDKWVIRSDKAVAVELGE